MLSATAGLWDQVWKVVVLMIINNLAGTQQGRVAAHELFKSAPHGLQKHHALADVFALRASYLACTFSAALASMPNVGNDSDLEQAE